MSSVNAAAAVPENCEATLLKRLGWEIQVSEVSQPLVQPGEPCRRADLQEARAAGGVQLALPKRYSAGAKVTPGASCDPLRPWVQGRDDNAPCYQTIAE